MKITVLSTFDVWPARDGGQTRYTSLWTRFQASNQITILAYDFRNTLVERCYNLTSNVKVVVPPASQYDANQFFEAAGKTGLWMHDILCINDNLLSVEFMSRLREALLSCDVLVAAHPYLANIAFPLTPANVIKVYESYNVEYDIKEKYLQGGRGARSVLDARLLQVRQVERMASQQADHVTAVSEDDAKRISELYGIAPEVMSVVPNGVDLRGKCEFSDAQIAQIRSQLGVHDRMMAIVVASSYGPNVESYRITRQMLDAAGFDGVLVAVGSIGSVLSRDWPNVAFEEMVLGYVTPELKAILLACAHFAPHFMFDGAGTNLKLFDYMGHGVPIIANSFGVRGTDGQSWYWPAETAEDLRVAVADIRTHRLEARARAEQAQAIALEKFEWGAIAADFERRMRDGFPVDRLAKNLG